MKEKVSIIVGIYNGEKYLEECIDSIIDQTYKNLEIILINDGSTDSSSQILKKYKNQDERIIVLNQKNAGVSNARNKGIEKSTGSYICIVDQDDVLNKEYVEYFYSLIKTTNSEIATTPQPNKFFGEVKDYTCNDDIKVISGKEAVIQMLYHRFVIAPWNKMIKRELIINNNVRFNPDFYGGEGFAFSIECFQFATKVALGSKKVYNYRVGDPETGASKYKEETINSSLRAQKYIFDKLIFRDEDTLNAWNFSNWHTNCDCFNVMVGCAAKKKNLELYNKLKCNTKKNAKVAFKAPISFQQKLRGYMFYISPVLAAKIINTFRIRKFKKEM